MHQLTLQWIFAARQEVYYLPSFSAYSFMYWLGTNIDYIIHTTISSVVDLNFCMHLKITFSWINQSFWRMKLSQSICLRDIFRVRYLVKKTERWSWPLKTLIHQDTEYSQNCLRHNYVPQAEFKIPLFPLMSIKSMNNSAVLVGHSTNIFCRWQKYPAGQP